ncbi:MAG: ribosomal-processing cysteine protease Prp [Bacilli bacterium]|nr:ribosomal-processing cysteine protease Prp [Bacilli bacterium]MDE6142188.1 ribosomal-processing cysteine protease Prp [Bacilli bacterium]
MIKVNINNRQITIKGHADYEEYGKDIVCASCSSIVITSINAALRFDKSSLKYEESDGKIHIEIFSNDEFVKIIIDNMLEMLNELALTYKKNIKIVKEDSLWTL